MIEKGRHLSLDSIDRLCHHSSVNEVDDEFHFTMKCILYGDFRMKLLADIGESFDINNLFNTDSFILIMSVKEYDNILPVVNFVKSAFYRRSNIVL